MDLELLDFGKQFVSNAHHHNLCHIFELQLLWVAINVAKTGFCIGLLFFDISISSILFFCNVLFTLLMLSLFLKLLCCSNFFGTSNRAFFYFNIGAFCLALSLMSSTSFYKASSCCALLIVLNRPISKVCCCFSLLISIPMHKVRLYFDINFVKFSSFLLCKHLFPQKVQT